MNELEKFLSAITSRLGMPYVWGKKGDQSFDCSGLCTWGIGEAGLDGSRALQIFFTPKEQWDNGVNEKNWKDFCSAQRLFDRLEPADRAAPGCLAFYGAGPKHIWHVMACMGDGSVFGATGGGSQTTAPTHGAMVRFKDSPNYRHDLIGFRKLPF